VSGGDKLPTGHAGILGPTLGNFTAHKRRPAFAGNLSAEAIWGVCLRSHELAGTLSNQQHIDASEGSPMYLQISKQRGKLICVIVSPDPPCVVGCVSYETSGKQEQEGTRGAPLPGALKSRGCGISAVLQSPARFFVVAAGDTGHSVNSEV